MIKELFLICALALPASNFTHDEGGSNIPENRDAFLRDWDWLQELLKNQYPDHEFLILPIKYDITPPGWEWVPFGWDGHLIYKRKIGASA